MSNFSKKILLIGSPYSNEPDLIASTLATKSRSVNNGLITNQDLRFENFGYYHTTVVDLLPGKIINIAKNFDSIILLDQDNYEHFKSFVTTFRLMQDLEDAGYSVIYKNTKLSKRMLFWKEYLQKNKSFCAFPFTSMHNNFTDGFTSLCTKSEHVPFKEAKSIVNWQSDSDYQDVRLKMIAGEKFPKFCTNCYDRETEGQESTRQFETLEWAARIQADSPEDFLKIKNPLFYEIWPSNRCNLMCRTCNSNWSHLIEEETQVTKIPLSTHRPFAFNYTGNEDTFKDVERVYWGGGEPTLNPDFYDFLRKQIAKKHTDFELTIGTNGMKISETLLDLLDHFPKVTMCFSFDGYERVNDYIRWKSKFEKIVVNSRIVRQRGHIVSKQTVFSMYSITRMHEVFEFYDREFPESSSSLLVQTGGGYDGVFMPFNHPCPDLVAESMEKCMKTDIYYMNGRSVKSQIDLTYNYYNNVNYKCDIDKLKQFYDYNDRLDAARGSRLIDYIPELDSARELVK